MDGKKRSDLRVLTLVAPGPLCQSLGVPVNAAARTLRVVTVLRHDEALEVLSSHCPGLEVPLAALDCGGQRLLHHRARERPGVQCLALAESVQ